MKRKLFYILIAIVFCCIICIPLYRDRQQIRPFDAATWRFGTIEERGMMIQDLINSGVLNGKKTQDVLDLLGQPCVVSEGKWEYKVDIGQDFIGHPWLYRLVIYFDPETGRVVNQMLID